MYPNTKVQANLTRTLDKVESRSILEIEVNSDDLIEVNDIVQLATKELYPTWKFNYMKVS